MAERNPAPDNPFERFDLDPRLGPKAITERLRELAEDAGPAERAAIRAAWEELTLHPLRRLRAALAARPETRGPLPVSPPAAPRRAAVGPKIADLLARPSVAAALGAAPAPVAVASPSLEDDPALALENIRHVR